MISKSMRKALIALEETNAGLIVDEIEDEYSSRRRKTPLRKIQVGTQVVSPIIFDALCTEGYIQQIAPNQYAITDAGKQALQLPAKRQGRRQYMPSNLTIYMGSDPEQRRKLIEQLDQIAELYGGRSAMIQKIARGELSVISNE